MNGNVKLGLLAAALGVGTAFGGVLVRPCDWPQGGRTFVAGEPVVFDFGPACAGGYARLVVKGISPAATGGVLRVSYACHPDGLGPKGDFWRETSARYLGPDVDLPILPGNINRYERYTVTGDGVYRAPLLQGLVRYARIVFEGTSGSVTLADFALDNDRVHSHGERAGSFDCSDAGLAAIWEASVRTCELAAIPAYDSVWGPAPVRTLPYLADGAKRDRLVWSGDLWWAERAFFSGFRPEAPYMKGSVLMLAANQTPEGYVQAAPWPDQAAPKAGEWGPFGSDEFAAWFVPVAWDCVFCTGDFATGRRVYPNVTRLMAYLARYQDPATGLFEQRKETCKNAAGLTFGATSLHHRAYMHVLLWKAYTDAAAFAARFGSPAEAEAYRTGAAKLATLLRTRFWDDAKGCFIQSFEDRAWSKEGNALALAVRFVTPAEAARIIPQIPRHNHGKFQALSARGCFEYGAHDAALALIDAHGWRKVLAPTWQGVRLTTECMGLIRKGWGDECHPDTAIAGLFTNYTLGIEPTAPGFETFRFRVPETARVTWAKGRVPTPHGEIVAAWKRTADALDVSVDVPAGTRCTLEVPGATPCELEPGAFRKTFACRAACGATR